MADQHKKTRNESSPGRAKPSPDDAGGTDGQVPEPGVSLEIETLGGATAGATDPTIKVRINLNLDDAD